MEAKSKWLTEDGNIIAPNTLDSCVFGSDGKSLKEKLPFEFGIDENGKYGYFKTNEETVTPFGTGDGGDLVIFDQNYSTEEQLTSKRWIDGKPIYQKSFDEQVNSSASEWVSNGDFSGLNIDNFIKIVGTVEYTDGKIFPINSGYLSMAYNPSTKSMVVTQTSMGSNYTWNVKYTILYTKTTDTADSPVAKPTMLHNYSTEEKVVGTWIDGRSIFERTWQIDNTTVPSNWDVTNADFENIAFVVEAILYDTDSETPRSVPVKTRKLSSTSIRFYTGDSWGSIDAYMIQYVKTTATTT